MPFAREEGDSLVVAWARVDVLVPESYFADPPLADDMGGRVETLCFVDVRARETEASVPKWFAIRLPARLQISYSDSSDELNEDGDKVRVFSSFVGEIFIQDLNVVRSADNVADIFRALSGARLRGASYRDLPFLFIEGARINGARAGVTQGVMEAIISEMARYDQDVTVPLRIPLAAGRCSEADFRQAKLKELPRINSVFTGIGFEDIMLSTQAAVRKSMTNEGQRESPMEEVVRY